MRQDLPRRWPRRGILIRLAIYVPLISLLAWRARGGCNSDPPVAEEDPLEQKLAPHRKVITLPDGTQQEVVELTAEEAEAILGHPIPRKLDEPDAKAEPNDASVESKVDTKTAAAGDAKPSAVKSSPDARPADARPAP